MSSYPKQFCFSSEDRPAAKWLSYFDLVRAGYKKWYCEGDYLGRPSVDECRYALQRYMPEFEQIWSHLISLGKADEDEAKMLSLYCPSAYKRGCAQAAWTRYSPMLIRNYDFYPSFFEGRVLKNKWFDTEVIYTADSLWGALDGMNQYGLCASLAYGGSSQIGEGFGVTLVLRYVLDFCKTTQEAIEVFKKIPVNMSYNITLLDKWNHVVTLELSPQTMPTVTRRPFAVNQQGSFDLSNYSLFSNSEERMQTLKDILFDPMVSIESFAAAFSYAPLFSLDYKNGFGTLYTSIYNPYLKACEHRIPGANIIYQSFENFVESEVTAFYKVGG